MIHDEQTDSREFRAIWRGIKRFAIRPAECAYKVGDRLGMREIDREAREETGREILVEIKYVTRPGESGLPPDLCVLSLCEFMHKQEKPEAETEPSTGTE